MNTKVRPTDLAQYQLLHGETEYEFEFPTAPTVELHIEIYADRPCSLFLHVRREGIDKWVPVVSSERRITFRGRFANCVGSRIHCAKDATLNALVMGHPVGVDPIDYTPLVVHTEIKETEADRLRREFRAMLDERLPKPRRQREIETDPELMGDEIPDRAGPGFEIDDDDPLDPADGVVLSDEPERDPAPRGDRTGQDPDRRPPPGDAAPDPRRAAAPAEPPREPDPQIDPRQRDEYLG